MFDAATVVNTYEFGPWGEPITTSEQVAQPLRFAGREWDGESALYFVRARYYDPALGRFISEDPIGLAGGINPFDYTASDPVNYRDPLGLTECADGDTIVVVISAEDGSFIRIECKKGGGGGVEVVYELPAVDVSPPEWRFSTPRESGATDRFLKRGSLAHPLGFFLTPDQDGLTGLERAMATVTPDGIVPVGNCIEKYTNGPLGVGLLINAGANVAVAGKGGYHLGATVRTSSWWHKVGSRIAQSTGNPSFATAGRFLGRSTFALTGLDGGYSWGIVVQCAIGAIE